MGVEWAGMLFRTAAARKSSPHPRTLGPHRRQAALHLSVPSSPASDSAYGFSPAASTRRSGVPINSTFRTRQPVGVCTHACRSR